jgi:hypothetical protein
MNNPAQQRSFRSSPGSLERLNPDDLAGWYLAGSLPGLRRVEHRRTPVLD